MLELKSTITEMKKKITKETGCKQAEERISKLEHETMEIIKSERERIEK